jgi:hypothetical protein
VDYPNTKENYAIRVIYDGAAIVDMLPGPALTDQDVKTLVKHIQAELIDDAGYRVGQRVLFASVPTKGCFRYRDVFQISLVPDEAPRPPFLLADHPLSLWCRFKNTPNAVLRIARHTSSIRKIELLLAAITSVNIHGLGAAARSHWVLLPGEDQQPQVGFQQEFYSYPGMNAHEDTLPDISGWPQLALVTDAQYASRLGISMDQVLDLPESFEGLCDRFFALDNSLRDAFLTAAFWLQHANRIHSYSRSAYFTALISAIEAVMPAPEASTNCPTCNRPIGKGPTKLFVEFAETFGPQDLESRTARRKLYGIRSALSHGRKLLRSDTGVWHSGLSAAMIDEWENLRAASQLVRMVLVGWLASQNPSHR